MDQFPAPHSLACGAGLVPVIRKALESNSREKLPQERLAATDAVSSSLGSIPHQEHLSRSSVPTPHGAQR